MDVGGNSGSNGVDKERAAASLADRQRVRRREQNRKSYASRQRKAKRRAAKKLKQDERSRRREKRDPAMGGPPRGCMREESALEGTCDDGRADGGASLAQPVEASSSHDGSAGDRIPYNVDRDMHEHLDDDIDGSSASPGGRGPSDASAKGDPRGGNGEAVSNPVVKNYCENCRRHNFVLSPSSSASPDEKEDAKLYYMELSPVCKREIREVRSPLRQVGSGRPSCEDAVMLCEECCRYLKKPDPSLSAKERKLLPGWKNSWPSFMWDLLTGFDQRTNRPFHEVYGGALLWRFIPETIRPYWRRELSGVDEGSVRRASYDFIECDEHGKALVPSKEPASYFIDRSSDITRFQRLVEARDLKMLLELLRDVPGQKPAILPDVLCPWGCTEFCFEAKRCDMALVIQHHLRKVQLNLPSASMFHKLHLVETSRSDYVRGEDSPYSCCDSPPSGGCCSDYSASNREMEEDYDCVLMNDDWPIRGCTILSKDGGLQILTCRNHDVDTFHTVKRLYPHPPRKPGHNLSACYTDDLCSAKLVARGGAMVQANKFNTCFSSSINQASYSGTDSFNVCAGGGSFKNQSVLLNDHASLSIASRPDMNQLMDRLVTEGTMPIDLANNLRDEAERRFGRGSPLEQRVAKCRDGATYVSVADSMVLHMNPPQSTVQMVVKRKYRVSGNEYEAIVGLRRSWGPTINFLETEDSRGYGTMLRPTKSYPGKTLESPTMMLWSVISVIASSKDVYRAIDQKVKPFRHDDWAGHAMAHVHLTCMKYADSVSPKGSPFKPNITQEGLRVMIERCLPESMAEFDGTAEEAPELFYRFSCDYWRGLFPQSDYASLSIQSSVADAVDRVDSEVTDAIIVVQSTIPEEQAQAGARAGHLVVNGEEYQARVILCTSAPVSGECKRGRYTAVRFARRGGGFDQWQFQRRGVPLTMLCDRNPTGRDFPILPTGCFSYVIVYAKTRQTSAEQYKLEFHRSLGGQAHVFCKCAGTDSFPLIVSGRRKEEKRACMVRHCTKKERYMCCNNGSCETRICSDHFEEFCKGEPRWLDPPSSECEAMEVNGDASERASRTRPSSPVQDVDLAEDDEFRRNRNDDDESTGSGAAERELDMQDERHLDSHDDEEYLVELEEDDDDDDDDDEFYDDAEEGDGRSSVPEDGDDGRVGDEYVGDALAGVGEGFEEEDEGDDARSMEFGGYDEDGDFENESEDVLGDESENDSEEDETYIPGRFHQNSMFDRIRSLQGDLVDEGIGSSDREEAAVIAARKRRKVREQRAKEIEKVRAKQEESLKRRLEKQQASTEEVGGELSPRVEVGNVLGDFLTESHYDAADRPVKRKREAPTVPCTNPGALPYSVLSRFDRTFVPLHVLMNQVGSLCTRYNKRIEGSYCQQNFVQRIVSTIQGFAIPLLYLMATCFPRHFYSSATHDPCAILGAAPLSCYSSTNCPHGFASTLSMARNLVTHSSSSASTDPSLMAFCYDIQANKVASGIDSRLISRSGFIVDVKSRNGLSVRDKDATLTESVDSFQAANDLAATRPFVQFDWFLTFTCNQAMHPGISHLHRHKESMEWTRHVDGYDDMSTKFRKEVKRSYEMAYGAIVGRCWMEVRKLWLEHITFSTSCILGKVAHVFFRDEFQEKRGNLSHIHGLVALDQEDMENEDFRKYVADLLKCAVCDMFPTAKIQKYIDEGLFEDEQDWYNVKATAAKVLPHKHNESCLRRVKDTEGVESYRCRKHHAVFGKTKPMEDEWKPLKFDFSPACLDILRKCELWEKPSPEYPNGRFRNKVLEPTRHMGAVHPGARDDASPCIEQYFAATRSMQNAQVLTGTNGVARYLVKYVVKLDQGNRCTVWADSHSGAVVRADHTFLHNTKITSSKANEEKAFEKSRGSKHPTGRAIHFTEMQQQILGYPEVMTTLNYARICTKPFEERSTTKMKLDKKGNIVRSDQEQGAADARSSLSPSDGARKRMNFPAHRQMTPSQKLLYRGDGACTYDKVTQFGLRPVELLQLFPRLGNYFRWFHTGEVVSKVEEVLHEDITRCAWVDGLGRKVLLRREALSEVQTHLRAIVSNKVTDDSWILRNHLLTFVDKELADNASGDDATKALFIFDDSGNDLPIPVYSRVTPRNAVPFLLHTMLVLGEFETELDLRLQPSMLQSFVLAKLIDPGAVDDEEALQKSIDTLVRKVVNNVFALQTITLRRLDEYIVMSRNIFEGVFVRNEVPIFELPPCLLTETLDSKNEELLAFRDGKRLDQLNAVTKDLPSHIQVPSREHIFKANKLSPVEWDASANFTQFEAQSVESYEEQKVAVEVGIRAINKYSQQFGRSAATATRGEIVHGAPGSGKTHVIEYLLLYAMSQGLRTMVTALMAARANALGGVHIHRLFGIMARKTGNPYRLAELALDKLYRKSQIKYLHLVLTMDLLIIDECGQLSAQQLSVLDIILRKARGSELPFGGVLVLGTMDHTQLGAIEGWPFLVSSHILTEFTLVKLSHSVRAHNDANFQRIQEYTRMSPMKLLSDPRHKEEFEDLLHESFDYLPSWDDDRITPGTQQMFSKRIPTFEASMEYVDRMENKFRANNVPHIVNRSVDLQRIADARAEYVRATSEPILRALNKDMKEPQKLLFHRGATFEATVNGEGYNQSQLLMMLDLPTADDLESRVPLSLMAAPCGEMYIDQSAGVPTREELEEKGWTPVKIGHVPERPITRRGLMGLRRQYALRHTGSSTINKQMGNTITGKCAVEISRACAPWEKAQIVVCLSRTRRAKDTMIVGEETFAINHIWKLITTCNQWTSYVEELLERLSVNGQAGAGDVSRMMNYVDAFPYRACDITLPTDSTGFIYMLVSVRDFDRDYVGQTENIARRFDEHNRGSGSQATSDPYYRPYCVAAYICGLSHFDRSQREHLEWKWKHYNDQVVAQGRTDLAERIDQGQRIVDEYNEHSPADEEIRLVVTIKRSIAERTHSARVVIDCSLD